MINRHSHDQSVEGEGVHVVKNEQCEDEEHGKGQYTEKRVYLSRCCKVSVPGRGGGGLHLEKGGGGGGGVGWGGGGGGGLAS